MSTVKDGNSEDTSTVLPAELAEFKDKLEIYLSCDPFHIFNILYRHLPWLLILGNLKFANRRHMRS